MTTRTGRGHVAGRQAGLSLVELMVSLVAGMLVVATVTALAINTSRTQDELSKSSRQVENARYALQVLNDEVRHAGFYGRFANLSTPSAVPDLCEYDTAAAVEGHFEAEEYDFLSIAVRTFDNASLPGCVANSIEQADDTDVLVVRRFSDVGDDWPLYVQSTPRRIAPVSSPGDSVITEATGEAAPVHRYRTDIYYVAPSNRPSEVCAGESGPSTDIPTLMRLRYDGGDWCGEPLAEGIERVHFDVGIDYSGDGVPNDSSAGADDAYVRTPGELEQLTNVVAVRIHLLARTDEPTPGHEDDTEYVLASNGSVTAGPFEDEYRRRVFATTVRLTNPAGRREE